MLCSTVSRLCRVSEEACSIASKAFASGRWYPQPTTVSSRGTSTDAKNDDSASNGSISIPKPENTSLTAKKSPQELGLRKEDAFPVFAKPRGTGKVFGVVKGKNNELLADYVLFEESMKKAQVPWINYDTLTAEEKTIYIAHLKAIRDCKLSYTDPITKFRVMTVSQLLYAGKCCGNGCRHCPYGHENATEEIRRSKKWNGAFYV